MPVDARNATLWQLILAKLVRSLSLVLAVSLAMYQPQLRPWTAFALLDVSREWSMFTHKWPAGGGMQFVASSQQPLCGHRRLLVEAV